MGEAVAIGLSLMVVGTGAVILLVAWFKHWR